MKTFLLGDKRCLGKKKKKSEICFKSCYRRTVVCVDKLTHLSRPPLPFLLDGSYNSVVSRIPLWFEKSEIPMENLKVKVSVSEGKTDLAI